MAEHPDRILRRITPDPVQLQVLLGCMLGDGRIEGRPGARRLRIAHRAGRAAYIRWKYDRLGALAAAPPAGELGGLVLRTIAHPLFDDLAALRRDELVDRLTPLGLAVWMTDVGRLDLRLDAFLPEQRVAALAS